MEQPLWQKMRLVSSSDDQLWELFHENSKIGKYNTSLTEHEVLAQMNELYESLPFEGCPIIELPHSITPLNLLLDEAITLRSSARSMAPGLLKLSDVATLLKRSYGITRDNKHTGFPRPFRAIPSAGALYPLELFFYSTFIDGIPGGLYHYSPPKNCVRLLREGNDIERIAAAFVQPELAFSASIIIFLTSVFERSVFKYGNRGYRFVLLEAGHLAQNLNLIATALSLQSLNIGGYFDRSLDDYLDLDGITQSTIYVISIGVKADGQEDSLAGSSGEKEV